jgi:hypothetical protein
MKDNIFDAVHGLGVKKIVSIVRSREMTIHAIRDKSLGIVHMGGSFPGIVGELDFMTRSAELWCRSADHGVISDAKNGKCNQNADNDKDTP